MKLVVAVVIVSFAFTGMVMAAGFCGTGPNGEVTTSVLNYQTSRNDCITTLSSTTIPAGSTNYISVVSSPTFVTYSSASASYLGISSNTSSPDSLTKSSASVSYLGISSATPSGGASSLAVTTGSAQGMSVLISSPTAIISFSSATHSVQLVGGATAYVELTNNLPGGSTSYLANTTSATFNSSLTQLSSFSVIPSSLTALYLQNTDATTTYLKISSASVSYIGISSLTISNGVLTVSSASLAYLGISSSTLTELGKSSAAVSYIGISSLTASNGVLTLSSAAVAYLGISSTSFDSLTKSSAAVSYFGISSNTFGTLNVSSFTGNNNFISTASFFGIQLSSASTMFSTSTVVLSTTANDYLAGDYSIAYASASLPINITGFGGSWTGKSFSLFNVSTQIISILNQSTFSASAHQINTDTGQNVNLSSGISRTFLYDGNVMKWRMLTGNFPSDFLSVSSVAASYLSISSNSVDSLTKSSASISYVGISSLTIANSVLSPSSASVSYLGISSGSSAPDALTKSSASVSYTALSTYTALTSSISLSYTGISTYTALTSSIAVAYLGISSAPKQINFANTVTGNLPIANLTPAASNYWQYPSTGVFYAPTQYSTNTLHVATVSIETGQLTGPLAQGNSVYMVVVDSNAYVWKTLNMGQTAQGNHEYRIVASTQSFAIPATVDTNGLLNLTGDFGMLAVSTYAVNVTFESLNGIGSNAILNIYRMDPSALTVYYGRIFRQYNAGLAGSAGFQASGSATTSPTYTWPIDVAASNNMPLTSLTSGVMAWGTTVQIGTVTGNDYHASTLTATNLTLSSATVMQSTFTTVVSTTMNNYQWGSAPIVFASATGVSNSLSLTGLVQGESGANFYYYNTTTTSIFIPNLSTFSVQSNRIALTTSTTPVYISSGDCVQFFRDTVNKLWRCRH